MSDHPDFLRSPHNIFEPDPRSVGFVILGKDGFQPVRLEDQHASIAKIELHNGVPEKVVAKFETAKNLNLFAWYVYRFHVAARSHAYECLELALKLRFKDELYYLEANRLHAQHSNKAKSNPHAKPYKLMSKEKYFPKLSLLLKHAIETGAIRNENFSEWQQRTKMRAHSRKHHEQIEEMARLGLSEMLTDDSEIEITDADRDHDYVSEIASKIPSLRNVYAHGTTSLDHKSLSDLRLTAEIINQIFPTRGV